MLVYIIRLIWLATLLFAFMAGDSERVARYRGWAAYLMSTFLVGVLSWVELMIGVEAWLDVFWPFLLVVLVLRGVALLEALHYQTSTFPWWSRMMAGIFLMASGVVMGICVYRYVVLPSTNADTLRDEFIRFRRYSQLWIGLVAVLTSAFYLGVRRHKHIGADYHAFVVGLLSLNYGAVGLIDMAVDRSPAFVYWEQCVSYSVDAALYLWWAFKVCPRICEPTRLYRRTGSATHAGVGSCASGALAPAPRLPREQFFHGIDTGRWQDNILQ